MNNKIDENYEKYKFIAENSPDILLQTTKVGYITYMSKNVETIFGYNLEEVIGKHFRNFVPRSEMPRYLSKMKEMISGKIIKSFRTYAIHKNGNLVPIELSGKFVIENNKSYFNAIMRDITHQVKTEEELKKSELQRKYILDTIPDLLFIINKDGFFTSYHGNTNQLYMPPNEFLHKKIDSVLPKNVSEETFKYMNRAFKTKKIQIFQYSLNIKDKDNWFEARLIAINNEEVMCIIRDITSSKIQQDELVKNREYLQNIINSASEFIFTIDKSKKIIFWNYSAYKNSGYKYNEIIDKNLNSIDLIKNKSEFIKYLDNLFNNIDVNKFNLTINTKNKTIRIWEMSPSIIKDESGNILEVLFICNDITYEKEGLTSIVNGRNYIFLEEKNDNAFNLFCKSVDKKKVGYIITRDLKHKIIEICRKKNFKLFQFSSIKGSNTIDDPNCLYNFINKNVRKNSVVYLDRLDYFINLFDFSEIIASLYKINEIIRNKGAILLMHINPDLISEEKITILKEEFYEYSTKKTELIIDKDLFEILKFIDLKNKYNIIVSFKEVGLNFGISKITVSKKIDKLVNLDLIETKKSGRAKILYLTNNGKELISKNI